MSRKAARRRQKTERRKKRLSALKADVTIDLLSDDEATAVTPIMMKPQQKKLQLPQFAPEPPHLIPLQTSKELPQKSTQSNTSALPQIILFPANIQISQVPNITLIPVQPLSDAAAVTKPKKNKRKTHPQKRPQPTLITESIVLTDDDDSNLDLNHIQPLPPAASTPVPIVSAPVITPVPEQPITSVASPAPPPLVPLLTAQVDEEVSVSLVPRSKASGTCGTSHNKNAELFPMLPDETTVHTVIANRIYELSLTKLREGLASCGIPEFADEQRKTGTTPIRRKKNFVPPIVTPPPVPISLKLSSDLSISLISDDDDDDAKTPSQKQHFYSSKLHTSAQRHQHQNQNQNIHLTVQHLPTQQLPVPLISASRDVTRQKPRKRKLG